MANSRYCSSVVVIEPLKQHASPFTLRGRTDDDGGAVAEMRWILEISHGTGSEKISGELELEIEVMGLKPPPVELQYPYLMKVTDKNGVLTRMRDCIPLLSRGQVDFIDVFLHFNFPLDRTVQFPRLTWGTGNVLSTGNHQVHPTQDAAFLIAGSAYKWLGGDVSFQASINLSSEGENPTAKPEEGESTAESEDPEEISQSDESEEASANVVASETEEMDEMLGSEESEEASESEEMEISRSGESEQASESEELEEISRSEESEEASESEEPPIFVEE